MKQIWPNYSYSPATNVLTLTGLNIDRDQLLLVTAADRGRIMYNFADSSVTASAFTSGANTALTLVATTAGLTTTAALVIYYDDQVASNSVTGTVELGPTSLNALESITVTMGQVTVTGGLTDVQLRASAVTIGGTVTVGNSLNINSLPAISGTVTANIPLVNIQPTVTTGLGVILLTDEGKSVFDNSSSIKATLTTALPTGTNRIGVVTIGGGTVTIGAGTAQIGSVTASLQASSITGSLKSLTYQDISNVAYLNVAVGSLAALASGTNQIGSVTVGNSVTISSLPALAAGTAQIGSVTVGNTVTIAGTVTANPTGTQTIAGSVTLGASTSQIGAVTASISNSVTIGSLPSISGAVTVSQLPRVTFIDNSGSITIANSAVTVFASSTTRSYLLVQVTTGSVFLNVGATATTLNGISLTAGQGYAWETTIPQGIVSLISTTTSSLYVAKQA